ncbi:hypothetical protein HanRHA438_Chr07g0322331 [Helianthus annuus]|nr:hypothetical protein HanRHA438_Chr07g0322331 [Helianthus annuus]
MVDEAQQAELMLPVFNKMRYVKFLKTTRGFTRVLHLVSVITNIQLTIHYY